jgi:hypothetical protein
MGKKKRNANGVALRAVIKSETAAARQVFLEMVYVPAAAGS